MAFQAALNIPTRSRKGLLRPKGTLGERLVASGPLTSLEKTIPGLMTYNHKLASHDEEQAQQLK